MSVVGPISETPPLLNGESVGPAWNNIPNVDAIPTISGTAYLFRFQVTQPITVSRTRVIVSTASGNMDIGIFSDAGILLGHTGSVAANIAQPIALLASISLIPGAWYRAALSCDNILLRVNGGPIISSSSANLSVEKIAVRVDGAYFPLANLTPAVVQTGGHLYCIYFWP
jgi:hypothetical protein